MFCIIYEQLKFATNSSQQYQSLRCTIYHFQNTFKVFMCFRDPLNSSGELSPTATHGRLCHTGPLKCLYLWQKVSIILALHSAHAGATRMLCAVGACCLCFIKGTVSRDSRLLFFFMNQFPPSPWVYHWGRFGFFRKFAEIFAAKGVYLLAIRSHLYSFLCLEISISSNVCNLLRISSN